MKGMYLITLFMLTAITWGATIKGKDFSEQFNGRIGTIVIYDKTADTYIVHNRFRSIVRYSPFSLFKIPNSVIALETGIIGDVDTVFRWDTTKYPFEAWWPPQWKNNHHTMRTAMNYSVVPFYRAIAAKIGEQRMVKYLRKWNYGNNAILSGIDLFWLNGSLAVSAMEQVDFLRRFYDNDLGVDQRSIRLVKDMLLQMETDRWRLSAKTGGGNNIDTRDPARALGWYAGYVEKGMHVYFFALNIETNDFVDMRDSRITITEAILKSLKIID